MPRANIQSAVEAYSALYNEAKALNELVKQGKGNKEKMNHASQILNENLHLIAPILEGETAVGSYKSILAENRLLKTKLDKFNEYMDIFSKIDENFENWTKKIEESISERSVREEIEAATKDNLKVIVKEAVDAITNTKDFKKTFSDVVKNSQASITKQTEKCFKENLTDALKRSQDEIVSQTTARHEADLHAREKRVRNIVLTNLPESTLDNPQDRIKEDNEQLAKITGLSVSQIEKSYRAGPPLGKGSNESRTDPRPLVAVLETPDLARQLHKYGNGNRILFEGGVFWVNPDLTRAERRANYHARKLRKERLNSSPGATRARSNNPNVATEEQA